MTMGRKSNSFRETYLQVVALIKTLHVLHAAELTEAARPGPAGEMVTSSGPWMKPPSTEALRDFDLNDDCVPEHPEHCDPEQPDDCGLTEDHIVQGDTVPVSVRFTTPGGRDWRDEALDEVRSVVLKHIQPGDAGDLEQNNVVIDRTNDNTFGFQIGMAVRKVCEQLALEKTNRLILLDSVSRQDKEVKKFKAHNEELQMRLSECVSRHEEMTKKAKALNDELQMKLSKSVSRHDEVTKKVKAQNDKLQMRLSESVSRHEEVTKKVKAQNEKLQMRLSESVSRHEEVTKKAKAQNEELRMSFSESVGRQEEEINNLKAQNEELLMRFTESVSRQEEVIKNLTAEKEKLQCQLIDDFLALRPQRPMCDSMCSNSFRISAINEPGNSALSTHEYRAGFVDPTPLVVEEKNQPAEKHPEHVQALETLPTNDCPPFPRSLKRKRTTRPGMQTRATSASEKFAIKYLTSEEKHVQEARQLLCTDRSPMPMVASSEHDIVMRVDHAAPHQVGQPSPRRLVEGCDSTTLRLKRIFGQQDKKITPHHRHVSPWHEDIQSAEPIQSKPRPRVYREYVCGIGDFSRKVTLGILKIYESGDFRISCRCAKRTCVSGAMWKPWDFVESHTREEPANKWWDIIWAYDSGRRQLISRLRNMDMYAAHNKDLMRQDKLKKQERSRKMMDSASQSS